MTLLSGWGRFPLVHTRLAEPRTPCELANLGRKEAGWIVRGNGRSYGDASVGSQRTFSSLALNRVQKFDPETGLLSAEAGILLSDIIDAFLPAGWFPAVVPGTRFVTLGGAIAADVHGKNHHKEGGFGASVERLTLSCGGTLVQTSRTENADLFEATIGGMGLTGAIVEAQVRLRSVETGWIREETTVANDLAGAMAALDAAESSTYSVAWIDCAAKGASLGRSLVYTGEHARAQEMEGRTHETYPALGRPRLSIPFDPPASMIGPRSVRAFNEAYFRKGRRTAGLSRLAPLGPYFFPLDGIGGWNRIYGPKGFVQHQAVLPERSAHQALGLMLERISEKGDASFLAVLKKLGAGAGILSFPMPGYTLALDFPVSEGVFGFLDELDAIVVAAGGRLYLAKDARQSRETFEAGYGHALPRFRDIRQTYGACDRNRSLLSDRLAV